jgi:hypothetical protein
MENLQTLITFHPFNHFASIWGFWKEVGCLIFYLPHMEYEGSIGFVTDKMKKNYRGFTRFRAFYT